MEPTSYFQSQINLMDSDYQPPTESPAGSEDFSDTIFWFLHENSNFSSFSSEWAADDKDNDTDNETEDSVSSDQDEKTSFWHDQERLLTATLCRTTPMESRIRQATEAALREPQPPCHCSGMAAVGSGCRSCSRNEISHRLCRDGFNCSIRSSTWKKTSQIPSGRHAYLEVAAEEKKRVIVELYLRSEFEMTMGGDHYNRLLGLLPEVFVGRPERLRSIVKILSGAAKRAMKENQLHVPPWRKLKYMQSKWFSTSTISDVEESPVVGFSGDRRKPRASMLTFALLGNTSTTHPRSVAVV